MDIKSSTCMDGGRLVFSFLALNKSRPLPITNRCWIAGEEEEEEEKEEEKEEEEEEEEKEEMLEEEEAQEERGFTFFQLLLSLWSTYNNLPFPVGGCGQDYWAWSTRGGKTNLSGLGGEGGGEESNCFFSSSWRLRVGQLSEDILRRSTVFYRRLR